MDKFIESLLQEKKVSIWGLGYLGYSTILRFHSLGFSTNVYDLIVERMDGIINGKYPQKEQKETWSEKTGIPSIDLTKIKVCKDASLMFDTPLHIICTPAIVEKDQNVLQLISKIFIDNKDKLKDSLVLFQSANIPGYTQSLFINPLKQAGADCRFAASFRSDWTIEEFLSNKHMRIIAADEEETLGRVRSFFNFLDISTKELTSIKEAEIYENAKNSLEYIIAAFFNQLILSYPDVNIRNVAKILVNNYSKNHSHIGIGISDYKTIHSIDQLFEGSKINTYLTLLKETENTNLSMILFYLDLLKRKNIKKVAIFGLSSHPNRKDIRMSPSLIIADYLLKNEIAVCIHDPYFDTNEIINLLPGAIIINLNQKIDVDVVIMMVKHNSYQYLNQKDIDRIGITKARIIIDNVEIFSNYSFPKQTLYHTIGNGKLNELDK